MLVYKKCPAEYGKVEFENWFKDMWRALQKHYGITPRKPTRADLEQELQALEYWGAECESLRGKTHAQSAPRRRKCCDEFSAHLVTAMNMCVCRLSELAAAAKMDVNVMDKYATEISVPLSANRDKICEALRAMWEEKKL